MIIGHQKIINLLDRSVKKGKIAQSYLFSGPESAGKFTLAKIFARALIENKGDWSDWGNKGDGENAVDLMVVEPEKEEKKGVVKEKEIKIEQIREARKNLLLFPYSGKYKVLIINNAHRMSESAQNSLLKILEEPNSTSIIILVTHEKKRILPTIQSRCQKINFSLVSEKDIEEGLEKKKLKFSNEFAVLSLGRPGIAISLCEDSRKLKLWQETLFDLDNLPKLDLNQRLEKAEELSKNTPEAIKKLELWIWTLRSKSLLSENRPKEYFKQIEMIENSISDISRTNASSRLILENLLINL